ncbi:hypothetical protein PV728_47865 [Streptomyces europaeiscabiei]|uniref:hypothetical protein n=1 Tax=Streptomyces europaeiscabiei TaxID=146819 RepID=UPI0029A0AE64|nr:hypothetical protein [Streptomyces europaeiscabiei]MDX3637768.1 hypothetical protein [Streptomyces europaeiscabiei]MDX3655580.1 hypothetical protein [Streptomyces europaeiscabiei]
MKIVSGAKHAAVLAGAKRIARELEDEKKANAGHLATIQRLRAELDQQRDRKPDGPVQQPKPAVGDAELQRRLNLALRAVGELQQRLDDMQTSHIADTRELHDLRQGVAS